MIPLLLQLDQLTPLFLVFARISGVLVAAPIFQTQRLPVVVRVGLAALLAGLLWPLVGSVALPEEVLPFILLTVREVLIGLSIGFVANLIFTSVAIAGEVADLQSGFAMASLIDPTSEERTAIIGQFQILLAWLVFFLANGHQVLLRGLYQSFTVLPLGAGVLPSSPAGPLGLITRTFVIALQIGAPILGAVLITDLALGMLARSVPQMNLLVVGMPVKMLFAFGLLMLSLPFLLAAERSLVPLMDRAVMDYLGWLAGGHH